MKWEYSILVLIFYILGVLFYPLIRSDKSNPNYEPVRIGSMLLAVFMLSWGLISRVDQLNKFKESLKNTNWNIPPNFEIVYRDYKPTDFAISLNNAKVVFDVILVQHLPSVTVEKEDGSTVKEEFVSTKQLLVVKTTISNGDVEDLKIRVRQNLEKIMTEARKNEDNQSQVLTIEI